jgi:hypothetical protein
MEQYTEDFANWIQSWSTRLENAYNMGIDKDGYPRFLEAMVHYDKKGKFTPGQMDYFLRRDADLGSGKLKDYNTYQGLDKRLGKILPAPAKAVIFGGFVDWSTPYQNLPDLTKRLAIAAPGWEFNARSSTWQAKHAVLQNIIQDLFE